MLASPSRFPPDVGESSHVVHLRMPVTEIEFPILQYFLCSVEMTTGLPPQPLNATPEQKARAGEEGYTQLPSGVVIGPDGKPCRTCTSGAAWKAMMRSTSKAPSSSSSLSSQQQEQQKQHQQHNQPLPTPECPPDVEELGRSTWTFLHTLSANYPRQPSATQQSDTRHFIQLFSRLYPCGACAEDFQAWMGEEGHAPRLSSREEFGRWMCEAHNAVNGKLGKRAFDCDRWEERWRTGWRDGKCD